MRSPNDSHREGGVFSDLKLFFLQRPPTPTLIDFSTDEERQEYGRRVLQRVDIDIDRYSVLNIHRIGIHAPVRFVFDQVRSWDGESSCWPDQVATVDRIAGDRRHIRIRLLGHLTRRLPLLNKLSRAGTLFELQALAFQTTPDPVNFDNARYLLYSCSGGYPIGIFCIYVRSPVHALGETEPAQLFFAVGFDFFGHSHGPGIAGLARLWAKIHNRVTGNILCRFRQQCERDLRHLEEGAESPNILTVG